MTASAQVSLEALIAIAILLMLLVFVYLNLMNWQTQSAFIAAAESQKNDCGHLQAVIALAQNPGASAYTYIQLTTSSDANLSGNLISFANYTCYFYGQSINAQLKAGNIRVKYNSGVVTVENY